MTERAKGRRRMRVIVLLTLLLLMTYGVLNLLKLWPLSINNVSRNLHVEIHANVDGQELIIRKRLTCINRYRFDFVTGGHRVWDVDSGVFNYIHPDGWGMRFALHPGWHCDNSVDEKIRFGEQGFPSIHILDDAHAPQSIEYYGSFTNVSRHDSVGGRLDTENAYMTVKRSLAFRPKARTDRVDMGSVMSARERQDKYFALPNDCVGKLFSVWIWTVLPEAVQSYQLAEMDYLPVEGTNLRMIFSSKHLMQGPGYMLAQNFDVNLLPPYASEFHDMQHDKDSDSWVVTEGKKNVLVLSALEKLTSEAGGEAGTRPAYEVDGAIVSYEDKATPQGNRKWIYNHVTGQAWVIESQYIMTNECWSGSKEK